MAESIGIANPIPSTPVPFNFNVFIPITLPSLFTKAPPLLPEFIAASVWIRLYVFPSVLCTVLLTALIIPDVTELCIPKGLPTAIANSPTTTLFESPSSAGVKSFLSIFITARSVCESVPTTFASYSVVSLYNVTVIFVASETA